MARRISLRRSARRGAGGSGRSAGRAAQVRAAFQLTRKNDPKMLPLVLGATVAVLAAFVLLGILLHHPIYFSVIGVLLSLMAATIVFGRRASAAAFTQIEGQPGAAAAVLQSMRGNWRVTPVVAVNPRGRDLVHRVVGRPGIVLVGEGSPVRVASLMSQERKKVGRVAAETPVYEVQAGDEDGQVPLRKLQTHLAKMPRNLKPAQVNALEARMRALGGATVPIPKGPLPNSGKIPRGKMR
ncbi:MAG: DUF4191 domain-containing protein [Mycobacteriales bacterium]